MRVNKAHTGFKVGQKLEKIWDSREVTIKEVNQYSITLDGDFEDNHVVMKDKVLTYYNLIQ